jgi:ubiquinone/menaquinone biosynthesis C-methylase UbiE
MAAPDGPPLATIAEAFSRTAEKYDAFAEDHPHLTRMRNKVYDHLQRYVPSGGRILELNAGSGTDAVALAARGYHVHATDISPGMLQRARDKIKRLGLAGLVTVEQQSFLELDQIAGPFDAVFSDLGGLNCVPDLRPVIESLAGVLRPGGLVTWVLMPPVCLWELATVFTQGRRAFRRLSPGGTRAHLEGLYFQVYYFRPRQVVEWFGRDYECLSIEGLSVITPTAESKALAKGHPGLYRALARLDDQLAPRRPWRGWGDFFIATFRFNPSSSPR